MIGIVIVSHSEKIAAGVLELAGQMTQNKVALAAAGGIDDPENPIGTDPTCVYEAIESVYSDDGVLVLMDLGSAIMSAEMALDFLTEEQRPHVRLCPAPLVEGAVAAAVQASTTTDIDEVIREALGGLTAKFEHLGGPAPAGATDPDISPDEGQEVTLTIRNYHGLHARPAAQFVSTAGRFKATIRVQNITETGKLVNAKSINQVGTLGARQGHQITLVAQGEDAAEALTALETLVANNFGESESAAAEPTATPKQTTQPAEGQLAGVAASPGIAIGPVQLQKDVVIPVEKRAIDDPQAEIKRLETALKAAAQQLTRLHKKAEAQVGAYEASIFEAQQLFLQDPALVDAARRQIQAEKINAEAAWQAAINAMVEDYRNLSDTYMQARAADVADVGQRVIKLLTGNTAAALTFEQPAILVATDLTPSDTAQLTPEMVLGICTQMGSATAHSAILARALGIPAVVGLGPDIAAITANTQLALDGENGLVWIDPSPAELETLQTRRQTWQAAQEAAKAGSRQPAKTKDGQRIEVAANIGSLNDVRGALDAGAEGVGLFRTEFLYFDRTTSPTEEEQTAIYRDVAEALGNRPLIIRTLDIGGDKPLPYIEAEPEDNPFLGWRGIRMMLDRPEMFKVQLRAILQASPGHNLKIMFPMVSTVAEVRAAKALFAEAQNELRRNNQPFENDIEIGIMIEVPAAVAVADQLAREVDFFSIGTNDLSQYTMAADRTNRNVSTLPDAFQPAVLRLIQQTVEAAHDVGIWVGLCGELGGNPLAVPLLVGLGLDELSMSAPAIPMAKQTIGQFTLAEAQKIAAEAVQLDSVSAVKTYLKEQQ